MIFKSDEVTSDKTIVIHGNKCIILFLTRYFMYVINTQFC